MYPFPISSMSHVLLVPIFAVFDHSVVRETCYCTNSQIALWELHPFVAETTAELRLNLVLRCGGKDVRREPSGQIDVCRCVPSCCILIKPSCVSCKWSFIRDENCGSNDEAYTE